MQRFLLELKRRRVFHVAAVYGAVAFVIAQVADIAFPALLLPAWALTLVVVLLILGFPIALVLAWAFDLTPEGVVRTEALPGVQASTGPFTGTRGWTAGQIAGAGAVVLLAGAGLAFAFLRGGSSDLERNRVLVAVFENQTGNPALDPVGRMAADWIARGLIETRSIEVISPTSALYAGYDDERRGVRAMAQDIGAGTVVTGAYYLEGGVLRFQAQVTDAVRGRLLHTLEPIGVPVDSATAGAELLRQRVAALLAARFDWSQELKEITRRTQPPTYAAYAEYVEGMQLFISRGQFAQAVERFERAWALDTTFYLPRLYSSLMYLNLGALVEMDSVLRSVARHRDRFTPYDRLLLENLQALLAGDYETGLRTARKMNEMAPGSLLAGHAVLAVATNRPREAVEVLRKFDPERGLLRGWESYWDWRTTGQHMLGEHRRELQEARQGRRQQPEMLSTLLTEVRALAALGWIEDVERLLEESLTLPPQQGGTLADVMRSAAAELRAHGQVDAAARALEKALAWYRTRPAEDQQRYRPAFARTLYEAERWAEARSLFEELTSEQPEHVHHLGHLGTLAARRGDRAEADRISAPLASSTQPYLRGAHTLWRARIAAQLGEREQALLLLREALAQGQPYGLWLHTDLDLEPLRDQRAFRELLRPKG